MNGLNSKTLTSHQRRPAPEPNRSLRGALFFRGDYVLACAIVAGRLLERLRRSGSVSPGLRSRQAWCAPPWPIVLGSATTNECSRDHSRRDGADFRGSGGATRSASRDHAGGAACGGRAGRQRAGGLLRRIAWGALCLPTATDVSPNRGESQKKSQRNYQSLRRQRCKRLSGQRDFGCDIQPSNLRVIRSNRIGRATATCQKPAQNKGFLNSIRERDTRPT